MQMMCRASALALGVALALPGQDWTEADVVNRFLSQNPITRQARARMAISEAEYRTRTLYANPTVSFSHEGAGRTEFYQASQLLPLSGRFPLLRQAGALQSQALDLDGASALWQARCALRASFYRLLALQDKGKVYQESLTELDRAIGILSAREREGEGSKLDRLRAERERMDVLSEWTALESSIALERGELLAFLPVDTALIRVAGALSPLAHRSEAAALVLKALDARADVQAERKRLEQFRAEQRAAARLRIPEPVVNAGLKRAEINQANVASGPVVGLSLAIPVFNSGKAEVARFGAEQEQSAARLDQLTRRVQAAVAAASQAFDIRRQALDTYRKSSSESGPEMLRIAGLAYQEGEIGILQWLDAYRIERQSRLRVIDLEASAKQAQISLEALVGEEFSR